MGEAGFLNLFEGFTEKPVEVKKKKTNNTKHNTWQEKATVSRFNSTKEVGKKNYAFSGKTRQPLQDQQITQTAKLDHRQRRY